MESKVNPEEVHDYLASLGEFHDAGALKVEQTTSDEVRIRWIHQPERLRPGGYVSGPTLFSIADLCGCLLYTSPSPRDQRGSRMPSSA